MNEKVSFTKNIEFKTLLNEITSISLEHTLNECEESRIKGELIISGTYKQTEASQIENPFSYKIPVDIEIDNKYDLSNISIEIDDFTYEVIENNTLKVNIDVLLNNLIVKENNSNDDEIEKVEDLFLDESNEVKLETRNEVDLEEKEEVKEEINDSNEEEKVVCEESNSTKSLFESIDTNAETYKTYSIYFFKENDNIEEIMDKYKVKRNELEEYNNLNEIKKGSKIIIPSTSE